jgi:dihydropteroate synthase
MLTDEEEIARVVPVIRAVKERFDIPISLDTYKSKVAIAGIEAGADMINDIWGLKYDAAMAEVIAKAGVSCCLTHNRKEPVYQDYIKELLTDLEGSLEMAAKAGIPSDRICVDPGVGFGKSYQNNLEIINRLEILHNFGVPILLGTSRKSVIGLTLDLPTDERLEGTLVTTVIAVLKGAGFVRVHDVKENVRTIQMTEAIKGAV